MTAIADPKIYTIAYCEQLLRADPDRTNQWAVAIVNRSRRLHKKRNAPELRSEALALAAKR